MSNATTLRIARPRVALAKGEQMWDIRSLADLLKVSRRTVERMAAGGTLPKPDKVIGRMKRWLPQTIENWMENR